MNKTKIEYVTHSWNPVIGCRHGCDYCYARRIAQRFGKSGFVRDFEPTLVFTRIDDPRRLKTRPARVFVCDMGDLFGAWVPKDWIEMVLKVIRETPNITYLTLTKNPSRYSEFAPLPDNCWAGATVTDGSAKRIFNQKVAKVQWLSVEPMLGPIRLLWPEGQINWIVVGAMSGPGAKQNKPDRNMVTGLAAQCEWGLIPLFMKDSIAPYWEGELIREYPK